ncbi:MAG: nucleotidyltransferase domain-containing protein [Methanoculleus sp.]|jgi:predicted nucleotidyltransferase|nr:nucleotidyltransferase domain-containing protein [Methanoculleus sp.]
MAECRQDLILDHFGDILPSIRAILLFGSRAMGYAGPESDTDLCLILGGGADRVAVYESMLLAPEEYDIVIYDEIPWYLRGEILERHCIIYAEDPDDLDFWLYKQRRIWSDMKRRQRKASAEDLLRRIRYS